ncbi:hypothetical protein D3C81_1480950 [compost metagenome]
MITQLAAQLMAHSAPQVDVRNRDNVDNGYDQFHGNRHKSEVYKLRPHGSCAAAEYETAAPLVPSSHADGRRSAVRWHFSHSL